MGSRPQQGFMVASCISSRRRVSGAVPLTTPDILHRLRKKDGALILFVEDLTFEAFVESCRNNIIYFQDVPKLTEAM